MTTNNRTHNNDHNDTQNIDQQLQTVIETITTTNTELTLYDELAPIYQHLYAAGYNYEKQAELIEQNIHTENPTIIDLGCGTGDLALRLAENLPNATIKGIDLSTDLLETARNRNTYDNLEFIEMNYNNLENLGVTADIYTSFGSLTSHLSTSQMKETLQVLHKTLNPNGKLITDYHGTNERQDEDDWRDLDGEVTKWGTETPNHTIECTIITTNRNNTTHYTAGYQITEKQTGNTYTCSQKIPLQFYKTSELTTILQDAGFTKVTHQPTAPDRSGTFIAHK